MNKSFSGNIIGSFLVGLIIFAFLYIFFVIRPELIFHHNQPPFVLSPVFYKQYFSYPGGPSELFANLVQQSFFFRFWGTLVLLIFVLLIGGLFYFLTERILKSHLNLMWGAIPALLILMLLNNYNFPFATVVSITFVMILLAILSRFGKNILMGMLLFSVGGILIYGFSGSGYMSLFSLASVFVLRLKNWEKAALVIFIGVFATLFPLLVSTFLFPVSLQHRYFYFFSTKAWFMKYYPSLLFLISLLSIPAILLLANLAVLRNKKIKPKAESQKGHGFKTGLAFLIVLALGFYAHNSSYQSDAKKLVKADYYSYKGDLEKTGKNAATTAEYNFSANLNYNLALLKNDRLSDDFFSFMQIRGIESLHPDIDFATELSFISSEYYYELGFISEARHWAYEALVFYPYSIRAMQNLVKIHLVLGEYKAAERTLNTLDKGLTGKKFVREYMPLVLDTGLILSHPELIKKRNYIPEEKELNRSIEGRLKELLEADKNNKKAFECLMLYYLLDAQLEEFAEGVKNVDLYFEKIPAIYEEALLMQAQRTGIMLPNEIKISEDTKIRYQGFMSELKKYKGQTRMARNNLYAEYGKSYLYFLKFVYPNILETEILNDEEDYPEI